MNYVEAKIPVVIFQEGDKVVAYSPALDLSTYGNTVKIAKKRFDEAAAIFFEELTKMGTLVDVLEECGWKMLPNKQFAPPQFKSCDEELIRIPV